MTSIENPTESSIQQHNLDLKEEVDFLKQKIEDQNAELTRLTAESKRYKTLSDRYHSMLGGKRMGENVSKTTHFYLWLCTLPVLGKLFDRSLQKAFNFSEEARHRRRNKRN